MRSLSTFNIQLSAIARLAGLALLLASATAFGAPSAIDPVPGSGAWMRRHDEFLARAKQGAIDVLFLGDSITDFWSTTGKPVWDANYAPLHAADFGISGDRTQHLLWRITNGELDGISPKVVVLLIGTNNIGVESDLKTPRNTPDEAIQGIALVVHTIIARLPQTKILLLGLFPRADPKGPPPGSDELAAVNQAIARFDDGRRVRYLDIGVKLAASDGTLPKDMFPDSLHPSLKGYETWANEMKGPLEALIRGTSP